MGMVNKIKDPIKEEMKIFEEKFKDSIATSVPLLDKITHYIVKRKGKQMRPMFVFLVAKTFGEINESSYRAASLVELLHTATLVHDDVVDDANLRRGFFSINALWKNKIAVLVGDYLLSKLLVLAVKNQEFKLLEITATAVEEMSEGELLQIEKARKLDIVESVYFDIIRKKTATLIGTCCSTGLASVSKDESLIEKAYTFGEKIGLAFQIKDDLFDYQQSSSLIGKPVGIDIKEQKMTLPLIYTLQKCSEKDKKFIIRTVKRHNTNSKRVQQVIKMVKEHGGLDYAKEKMNTIFQEALEILETFPDNASKESLRLLVEYVIKRKK
ncbi:MAG: polyprenyl synthetase family protein [Flavobacteriales bacterium]|jgi:octaprenyl-diphosphate synthase|nr:polyprenyl synthetase family protein [Flavobacteriales bacterium]